MHAFPLRARQSFETNPFKISLHRVVQWWAKQEPLCLEIDHPLSIPEKLLIGLASRVEGISLVLSNYMGDGRAVSIMSPRVLQAFLWPLHN